MYDAMHIKVEGIGNKLQFITDDGDEIIVLQYLDGTYELFFFTEDGDRSSVFLTRSEAAVLAKSLYNFV